MSEARAKRKSPVRIATVLSQRAFADGAPRRSGASSITSSWYSVARWVSSPRPRPTDDADGVGVAELRGHSATIGRNRLPPASTRWRDASETNGSSLVTASRRPSSTASQAAAQPLRQLGVGERDSPNGQGCGHVDVLHAGQRTKTPPASARSRIGLREDAEHEGDVATTIAIGTVVNALGTTTVGPSGAGSEKNIRTIDPDVEERGDGAGEHADDHEPARRRPRSPAENTRELPMKPLVSGMPASASRNSAKRRRRAASASEPGPLRQVRRLARGVAHQRDDAERADRREAVGQQVEHRAREARRVRRDDARRG